MSPCLNGETAARDLTLTSTGGGSSSDMQRSPLYLVGCGWVGEDFKAPRSGAFLKHLGVHGVFCDAPEKTNAKTRAASIPRGLGTECMLRQNAKMHIPSRVRASGCISRLFSRAPAQCLPITLNSLRSVSVSLENGALSTVGVNQH